jgi:hypothetical protein
VFRNRAMLDVSSFLFTCRRSRASRRFSPRMILVDQLRRTRMSVAVTFCAQPENERRDNEYGYSFFRGSETESLSEAIESGAPVRLQLRFQLTTNDTNRHEFRKRAVELKCNRRLPACTTESKPFCKATVSAARHYSCSFVVVSLLPRPDRNRAVMPSDIGIVEPRF